MSWLFDQISDLARADSVGVVIAADTGSCSHTASSIDLAELLVRASRVPSLSIELLPARLTDATFPPEEREEIDLGTIDPSMRVNTVRRMLKRHQTHCGAVLRLQGSQLRLEPCGTPPDRTTSERDGGSSVRWMLASDHSECPVEHNEAMQIGLNVAIGGMSRSANVNVEDVAGFVALLDALVSLREVILESMKSS